MREQVFELLKGTAAAADYDSGVIGVWRPNRYWRKLVINVTNEDAANPITGFRFQGKLLPTSSFVPRYTGDNFDPANNKLSAEEFSGEDDQGNGHYVHQLAHGETVCLELLCIGQTEVEFAAIDGGNSVPLRIIGVGVNY
jgi:hypothetical protein